MRRLLLVTFVLATLVFPLLLVAAPSDARNGVAVVFAPWVGEAQAMSLVAESGGALVRTGAFSFITVAIPKAPDFAARVRSAGAWILLDPQFLDGCFSSPPSSSRKL
jgi:hypothetical protein